MDLTGILALIALIFALGTIYVGVQIANELRSRGISAKPLLVRWMLFKYMAYYRRVTLEETGKVGPLYQRCSTMLLLTLVFGFGAILSRFL